MVSRILWIVTAGLIVGAFLVGEMSFEGPTASVIDAGRTPITFGSIIAGWGATIAGWTGYRSDVPWFNTGKENTWSERQIRRASDHIAAGDTERSEEHTSELQSRGHLVCRLLLEKKKKQTE